MTAERLRHALLGMVEQFAYYGQGGYLHTGGLSALEEAFAVLGWPNPYPAPDRRCDEPGCPDEGTSVTPSSTGYRRVCFAHYRAILLAWTGSERDEPREGRG
jgi:hypothetical protein